MVFFNKNFNNSHDSGRAKQLRELASGLPWADGQLQMMDTHVHTRYSDGSAAVTDVEDACTKLGIGACITDHNEIRGTIRFLERGKIPTLPSIETGSQEKIELMLYFKDGQSCEDYYKKQIEPYRRQRWYAFLPRPLDTLMAAAMDYDVLVSIPHPYAPLWKNVNYGRKRRSSVLRTITQADCIEVLNGGLSQKANRMAMDLCEDMGMIPLGGSDSHHVEDIGSVVVAFSRGASAPSLFHAMSKGHIRGIIGLNERPRYLTNAWHMAKKHSIKFIHPSARSCSGYRS